MCGIFGIEADSDAANLTYLGLFALQHRGQESAGAVSWDGERLHVERGMGHVFDVFSPRKLARLHGSRAIGHARYSTTGQSVIHNAQPIVVKTSMGPLGIVHNGNLINAGAIRKRLEYRGSIFQTTSDTEVILHLMARKPRRSVVESLMMALEEVRAATSSAPRRPRPPATPGPLPPPRRRLRQSAAGGRTGRRRPDVGRNAAGRPLARLR